LLNLDVGTAWDVPFQLGAVPFKFKDFGHFVTGKGRDGFGNQTAPETLLNANQLAFDKSKTLSLPALAMNTGRTSSATAQPTLPAPRPTRRLSTWSGICNRSQSGQAYRAFASSLRYS
jgi:hypothetical protein